MLISVIIQIHSKSNDRIVKSDAILTKLGGIRIEVIFKLFQSFVYLRGGLLYEYIGYMV